MNTVDILVYAKSVVLFSHTGTKGGSALQLSSFWGQCGGLRLIKNSNNNVVMEVATTAFIPPTTEGQHWKRPQFSKQKSIPQPQSVLE